MVHILRRFAERLSRGKVFKRRLPLAFGRAPIFVSPDSQLKYLKMGASAFDAELLEIAASEVRPPDVVWDVGANVGVFAISAAALCPDGSVLAIEPDMFLASLLRRSLALVENRRLKVEVLPAAISNRVGTSIFLIAGRGRASNALESSGGRMQTGGVRERIRVPTLTLDSLLLDFPPPSFVKIDVEGAELLVLQGSTKLLKDVRPRLYIEVGKEQCDAVTKVLVDNNYILFEPASGASARSAIERCVFNTLAVPGESIVGT